MRPACAVSTGPRHTLRWPGVNVKQDVSGVQATMTQDSDPPAKDARNVNAARLPHPAAHPQPPAQPSPPSRPRPAVLAQPPTPNAGVAAAGRTRRERAPRRPAARPTQRRRIRPALNMTQITTRLPTIPHCRELLQRSFNIATISLWMCWDFVNAAPRV